MFMGRGDRNGRKRPNAILHGAIQMTDTIPARWLAGASTRMRVLVVTSQFPIPGDLQRGRAVHQTVLELARMATVAVISPVAAYPLRLRPQSYIYHAAPEGLDAGVPTKYVTFPVLPLVSRPFNGWLCGRALESEVEDARPDVVLAYWLYPDAYGALAATRRLKIPLVAGARGSDLRTRDPLSRSMTRKVVREADRLLVVSRDLKRIAIVRDGASADRVIVIPNGCDSSIFRLSDRVAARNELGIPSEAALVLYVGRLVAEKGLRELLEGMAILRRSGEALRLAIVGDGPMRAEIERRAACHRIRLHCGPGSHGAARRFKMDGCCRRRGPAKLLRGPSQRVGGGLGVWSSFRRDACRRHCRDRGRIVFHSGSGPGSCGTCAGHSRGGESHLGRG